MTAQLPLPSIATFPTGNQVRFEKLFVVGEEMTLFVDYHAPSSLPGWLHTLVSVCGLG